MPSDIGPFLAAGALGAFWFGGNVVNHLVATANVNDASDELVQIPAFLSINVPGYGESPETIKTCLESIYSQNVLR
jgi:cellulose synthase/poly-beta-1,6-N-acetylglucosamine synthase-like glycosyltransferase